jgi:hypothetical protein
VIRLSRHGHFCPVGVSRRGPWLLTNHFPID